MGNNRKKIAISVIGTVNKDLVLPFNDVSFQSLGGIVYSIATLLSLGKGNITVYPVSYVGEDIADLLNGLKDQWKSVDFSGLVQLPQKNHQVILEYYSPSERKEKALFFFPPIEWQMVEKYLQSDMVLVNMITGKEMELETYRRISGHCYTRLYIDLHFLLMDTDELGNRFPRRPADIFEWINYSRFIQMNETEYSILNSEGAELEQFWGGLLRPSQHVFITLGEKGVLWISNEEKVQIKKFPAYRMKTIKDATGCGDAFGAGFCFFYARTGDIELSVKGGILAASASTGLAGTEQFDRLPEMMHQLDGQLMKELGL